MPDLVQKNWESTPNSWPFKNVRNDGNPLELRLPFFKINPYLPQINIQDRKGTKPYTGKTSRTLPCTNPDCLSPVQNLTPPKISPASQQTPPRSLALAPVGWNSTICFSIKSARKFRNALKQINIKTAWGHESFLPEENGTAELRHSADQNSSGRFTKRTLATIFKLASMRLSIRSFTANTSCSSLQKTAPEAKRIRGLEGISK